MRLKMQQHRNTTFKLKTSGLGVQVVGCPQQLQGHLRWELELRDALGDPAAVSNRNLEAPGLQAGSRSSCSGSRILVLELVVKVLADFLKNWRGDVWEFDLTKFCLSEATCRGTGTTSAPACSCCAQSMHSLCTTSLT